MVAAVVMVVAGVLVTLVGVLGWMGRLPRNRLAGLRTPATLRSDRAFEAGNRAAGPATTLGGAAAIVSGVIAAVLPEGDVAACVLVGALVLTVLAVVGAVQGVHAARRAG
jgi:uncharacterized membrane protein